MNTLKGYWSRGREVFSRLSVNDWVILLFVFSTFVSVFLQAAFIFLLPFYFLLTKQGKKALPKKKVDYLLLIFAMVAVLSTFLFAKDATINDFQIRAFHLKLLSLGVVVLVFDIYFFIEVMNKRLFRLGLQLFSLLSVSSFLVAQFQKIFEIYPDPVNRPGRVASVFMNENYFGTVIEFVSLITLYLFCQACNRKHRIVYGIVLLLNIIGLWYCQCRTAFIVIAAAFFVFVFIYKRKLSGFVLGFFALIGLLLLQYPSLLPRFESASSYLDFRIGIWQTAFRSITDNLLIGRGYFSYSSAWIEYFSETYYPAIHAHNLYIEILLNFGLIGAICLGSFVMICAGKCIKCCLHAKDKLSLALVFSTITAIFVHGLADTTIFWPQTGFFVVFLLSCPRIYGKKTNQCGENLS